MRFGIIIGAAFAVLATPVFAQVKEREVSMKEVGAAFGQLNRMNRGQTPYSADAAKTAFATIATQAARFAMLYDETPSPAGRSLAAIWENKADFDARLAKLAESAKAGSETSDEAGFKTAFADLQPSCGSCHQVYRGD